VTRTNRTKKLTRGAYRPRSRVMLNRKTQGALFRQGPSAGAEWGRPFGARPKRHASPAPSLEQCGCPSNPEGTQLHVRFCVEALPHNTMAGSRWVTDVAYGMLFNEYTALRARILAEAEFHESMARRLSEFDPLAGLAGYGRVLHQDAARRLRALETPKEG
jgi:hypothetical protein